MTRGSRLPRSTRAGALLLIGTVLLSGCGARSRGGITISEARAPAPSGPNGVVYMTLLNTGPADRLTAARTDAAGAVELHEAQMTDGAMRMQRLDGIDIPAGGQVTLEPGGLHAMLVDVDPEVADGDNIRLTLSFARAGDRVVTAEVMPIGDHAATRPDPSTDQRPTAVSDTHRRDVEMHAER